VNRLPARVAVRATSKGWPLFDHEFMRALEHGKSRVALSTTRIASKKRGQLMPWTAWSSLDASHSMLSALRLLKCIEPVSKTSASTHSTKCY